MNFWNTVDEIRFFKEALKSFASPGQLFYKLADGHFAYAPKGKTTEGQTLQSRNSLIGQYTERWCKDFFQPIAKKMGLYAVNSAVCPELGLTHSTDADVAFCTTNDINQSTENIKLIFEVKMSIVNNYSYDTVGNKIKFEGDYTTHKGNPSTLRSDSMLKAIGKSINIRVSDIASSKIPILILGNSPITKSYEKKVDFLKQSGVIQGFVSLYPNPSSSGIKETQHKGFQTFENYSLLEKFITDLITSDMNFFSSMLPKKKLGKIITTSSQEDTDIKKAEKFLELLTSSN